MNTREQGDQGELAAAVWLAAQGAHVFVPLGHSPHVDLVADVGGRLIRVQVKTTRRVGVSGRWEARVCTRGGNQSWSGMTKMLDPELIDYLFVLVGDGRQWFIPADSIGGMTTILLGGPKYAEFEVDRGRPIRDPRTGETRAYNGVSNARGDVRVVKGARL